MSHDCLAPNSPGALAVARALRDGQCVTRCDGGRVAWCNKHVLKQLMGSAMRPDPIKGISRWGGSEPDV